MSPAPTETAAVPERAPFSKRWALPILLVGIVCTAFSPVLVRVSDVGPVATGFYRAFGALPIYAAMLVFRRSQALERPFEPNRAFWFTVLSGVFFAADVIVWNTSVTLTSVANAALLGNLTPIFVAAATWLFLGQPVRPRFALGMVVALAGSAVMMARSYQVSLQGLLGDGLAISASGFYAGYMLTTSFARRTAPVIMTMIVSMTVAAAILFLAASILEKDLLPNSLQGWLVVAAMVLLVQVGGQTLVTLSLAHVSANLTALMFLIQPMIPATVAWYLFGEAVTALQFAGAALVLVGLEIARRASRAG